jgi:hypothetical protein
MLNFFEKHLLGKSGEFAVIRVAGAFGGDDGRNRTDFGRKWYWSGIVGTSDS